jgi:thiol-disulfide isomerase/thioredoxin
MKKRNLVKIACLLSALFLFNTPPAHAISWSYDLESALKRAKDKQKPVMVDFYTDWCGWCKKLDSTTYADTKVTGLAAKFICVKIDGDKNRETVTKYSISGYPTIFLLDPNGSVANRIVGYTGPEELAKAMKAVLDRAAPEKKKEPVKEIAQEAVVEKPARVPAGKKNPRSQFELTGIITHPSNPKAIVNDKIVKVGDEIDGAKVLEITGKKVKLLYKEREITLELQE